MPSVHTFSEPGFDYLNPGTIILPEVPIYGQAIQVGIPEGERDKAPKTNLQVDVLKQAAHIAITLPPDKQPFAVQFSDRKTGVCRVKVFEPAESLHFKKAPSGLWQVKTENDDPLTVVHGLGFSRFAGIVRLVALGAQVPSEQTGSQK